MRRNEELEFAVAELKRYNIRYETRETEGGHVEIRWQVSDAKQVRQVFTSKTSSDHRTRLNARSYIRQALRQDGVNTDQATQTQKKPSKLEQALKTPEPVETIPDQLRAMRSELADLTDLLLDISNSLAASRQPEPVQPVPEPITEVAVTPPPSSKQPSVRSKKVAAYLSTAWNSIDAIARDMGLPFEVTYRKLYYLKGQDKVEMRRGECRLKPTRPQLLRAEG
jgi:predicted Rossmann fold nucleotide-binding protein DprA/Smf involved in DNA uptake